MSKTPVPRVNRLRLLAQNAAGSAELLCASTKRIPKASWRTACSTRDEGLRSPPSPPRFVVMGELLLRKEVLYRHSWPISQRMSGSEGRSLNPGEKGGVQFFSTLRSPLKGLDSQTPQFESWAS